MTMSFHFDGHTVSPHFLSTLTGKSVSYNETLTPQAMMLNDLLSESYRGVRIAQIVFSVFSLIAVLAVLVVITLDTRTSQKILNAQRHAKISSIDAMHPAEVLPLFLASALFLQQIFFIAVQASGLNTPFVHGCTTMAQIVWPSIFSIPLIILTFTLDSLARSLYKPSFAPRGKGNVIFIALFMSFTIILTWIISDVHRPAGECFASLPWWLLDLAVPAVGLIATIFGITFLGAGTLAYQLWRDADADVEERTIASREVFYSGFMLIILVFVLPFFAFASESNLINHLGSGSVAGFALSFQGIIFGLLHALLRSNATIFVIKPSKAAWPDRRPFRLWGPNGLDEIRAINNTTDDSSSFGCDKRLSDLESTASIREPISEAMAEKKASQTFTSYADAALAAMAAEERARAMFPPRVPAAPGSGNWLSNNNTTTPSMGTTVMNSNRLNDSNLAAAPRTMNSARRHRRLSSNSSVATVQIGLRLSMASATLAANSNDQMREVLSPPLPPTPPSASTPGLFKTPRSPLKVLRSPFSPTKPSPLQQAQSISPPTNNKPFHNRSLSQRPQLPSINTAAAAASAKGRLVEVNKGPVSAQAVIATATFATPNFNPQLSAVLSSAHKSPKAQGSPPIMLSATRYVPGAKHARNASEAPSYLSTPSQYTGSRRPTLKWNFASSAAPTPRILEAPSPKSEDEDQDGEQTPATPALDSPALAAAKATAPAKPGNWI